MAIKKRENTFTEKEIRNEVTIKYERESEDKGVAFVGLNKKGNLYLSLGDADNHEFIGGYEALSIINQLLYQFDTIEIVYNSNKTKNGNEYEVATLNDYKI